MFRLDPANEPVAGPRHRFNKAGPVRAVVQYFAQFPNAAVDGVVKIDMYAGRPQGDLDMLPGYDLPSVFQQ